MNEGRLPSPDFDETRYQRPNKAWICGRAAEGCPCRIGPGPKGDCRATTECQPQLVRKAGEEKGTWVCTLPKDWGGPCPAGPLPDGTCCRVIPKCQPVRSLRARRGLVTGAFVAVCAGVLLIALAGPHRDSFINPAPLSRQHSGAAFARRAGGSAGDQGCALCHTAAGQGAAGLTDSALRAAGGALSFAALVSTEPKDFSRIDHACLQCHAGRSFHQASVAHDTSCSVCHREHQGAGALPPVAARHCTDCHGDPAEMQAAAAKARTLAPALVARHAAPGVVIPAVSRPAEGFTRVITGFAADHPDFRVLREAQADASTLRFNHRLHLGGDIPLLNGRPLDCASCHQPDAAGAFMPPARFEQNCRACHSLNFDENNPGMQLPHGDAAFARAYLRSLPAQYADHAARSLGLTEAKAVTAFVEQQMAALRTRVRTGEELERLVFLSDGRSGPAVGIAGRVGEARARFAGCALCHEVTPHDNAAPTITPPQTPGRWLLQARFDHSKHTAMACTECHAAPQSQRTADILLPSKQSCVKCHSPQGGVADSCATCHSYHQSPPAAVMAVSTR